MMTGRRFPWAVLLLLWAAFGTFLVHFYWPMISTLNLNDADDFLRLQQIRDYINGQSWFDLTQKRMAAPEGLAMHWSRLVDLPVLLFLIPLTPILGAQTAEIVAIIGAPLLNLLVLMIALVAIVRRLIGTDPMASGLACFMAMSAPSVFTQIHPGRIDHHGWQIAIATVAVAALLQRAARLSGVVAGLALALYLNISIEGVPFVAAAVGIVGLLWAFDRDYGVRLTSMLWALALGALGSNLLTAPYYRWTEGLCDALMPSHLAAMGMAAVGTMLSVRFAGKQSWFVRIGLLVAVMIATLAVFGVEAPTCLGSPFGKLDPVINNFWYRNVLEGMPFWRQDNIMAASTIAFPALAVLGSVLGALRTKTPEMRRRWMIMLVLAVASLMIGAMVRRASGVAHVLAVPGALVLIGIAVRWAEARLPSLLKIVAMASAVLALTPIVPVLAVAAMTPDPASDSAPAKPADPCDRLCVLKRLAAQPPERILANIDLGPIIIAHTTHSVYGSGYHRMEGPLRETILFFEGSPEAAHAFVREKGFRTIMVNAGSDEATLFIDRAPNGLLARLVKGPVPNWLVEDPVSSSTYKVFRVRD
jgi:hypothetical protein